MMQHFDFPIFFPVHIGDTLTPLAKTQGQDRRTGTLSSPTSTVAPLASVLDEKMAGNVSYKCRPEPAFAHGDLVSAYAGLFITFVMAIYARWVYL